MVQNITSKLDQLQEYNPKFIELFSYSISGETSGLYDFDLYFAGVANRAIATINSFMILLPQEPLGALTQVRIHMDTFLRSGAPALSANRSTFVREVREGGSIRSMQMHPDIASVNGFPKGAKLTDANLKRLLSSLGEHVESIYDKYCEDIHFSGKAISKAVSENEEGIHFSIGTNSFVTDDEKEDAIDEMIYISGLIFASLSAYVTSKASWETN